MDISEDVWVFSSLPALTWRLGRSWQLPWLQLLLGSRRNEWDEETWIPLFAMSVL